MWITVITQAKPQSILVDTFLDNTNTKLCPYLKNAVDWVNVWLWSNRLYFIPFMLVKDYKNYSVSINVTTWESGKKARIGIYEDNWLWLPKGILWQSNNIDISTNWVKETVFKINLKKNKLYFMAIACDSASAQFTGVPIAWLWANLWTNKSNNTSYTQYRCWLTTGWTILPDEAPTLDWAYTSTVARVLLSNT